MQGEVLSRWNLNWTLIFKGFVMRNQWEMEGKILGYNRDQKGWLKDISSFLKCPGKLPKVQNWRSYALLKLDIFAKLPKVNYPQTSNFVKWAHSFPLDLILSHYTHVLASALCSFINFSILFDFYLNYSILNQFKSNKITKLDYMRSFSIFRT